MEPLELEITFLNFSSFGAFKNEEQALRKYG